MNYFSDFPNPTAASLQILEVVLVTLKASMWDNGFQGLRPDRLFALRSFLRSPVLEDMLAGAVNSHVPIAHHGRLPETLIAERHYSLGALVSLAETRWNPFRNNSCRGVDLLPFLMQTPWTSSTAQIVSNMLYCEPASRRTYLSWLSTGHHISVAAQHMVTTLHAYLDCVIQDTDAITTTENGILLSQFSRLLSSSCRSTASHSSCLIYADCLFLIVKRSGSRFAEFLVILQNHIQYQMNGQFGYEFLLLGRKLHSLLLDDAGETVTSIVDLALQSTARRFSGAIVESVDGADFIDELSMLLPSMHHNLCTQ